MAFPTLASSSVTSDVNQLNTVVTMPSGIVAGDLLLIFAANDTSTLLTASAGWTQISSGVNGSGSNVVSMVIFGKIAVGGDSCTLTDAAVDSAVVAARITGHGVVALGSDIFIGTAATGSSLTPDPPNCNPAIARDYLWLEMFAMEDGEPAATYWSTTFAAVAQVASAAASSWCMVSVGQRNLNAASLNPATMAANNNAQRWVAQTLAIKPFIDTALATTINGTAAVTGVLSTQIALKSTSNVAATVTGVLSTQIPLIGTIAASGAVTAALSTSIACQASLALSGILNGTLLTQIALVGNLTGVTVVSVGDLSLTGTPLMAALLAAMTSVGNLSTAITLRAASLGSVLLFAGELTPKGIPGVSNQRLRLPEVRLPVLRIP